MADVLLIGFVAMSCIALTAILYGFRLTRLVNSDAFRREIFNEVARENHREYMKKQEVQGW